MRKLCKNSCNGNYETPCTISCVVTLSDEFFTPVSTAKPNQRNRHCTAHISNHKSGQYFTVRLLGSVHQTGRRNTQSCLKNKHVASSNRSRDCRFHHLNHFDRSADSYRLGQMGVLGIASEQMSFHLPPLINFAETQWSLVSNA